MQEKIIILDFGSSYTQLIARRVREYNVFCEIYAWNKCPEITANIKGIILSSGSFSSKDENSPQANLSEFIGKVPVLAIGYNANKWAFQNHGQIETVGEATFEKSPIQVSMDSPLFSGVESFQVWKPKIESLKELPTSFKKIAVYNEKEIAAYIDESNQFYGLHFHPEVFHTTDGAKIIRNFTVEISKCSDNWTPELFVEKSVLELRKQLGNDRVILALSGGVDSSVAAGILQRAIGDNLHCIFVNHGLLRKNEYQSVLESYKSMGLNIKGVDASKDFFAELKGVTDPEKKRKIIGAKFVDVFDQESKLIDNAMWLGQGTIYPDVIESISADGNPKKTIKSHHNVGGLPDYMKLKIVEPLRMLFKDEVRKVGKVLGIPEEIVGRHPFPGPGLGIRTLGEVTPDKIAILQEADAIFIEELKASGWYDKVWQAGVIFLPVNTVGVTGEERTYEHAVALRAVSSIDGMTADWCEIPYEILGKVSNRIIREVKGINRVTYDISSKPPATIEWE